LARTLLILALYLVLLVMGQLLWKHALVKMPGVFSEPAAQMFSTLGASVHLWCGLFLYALATGLWLYLLSKHDLSFIYPFTSLSFVLGVAAAAAVLGESVSLQRWIGVAIICLGVYVVSRSA
jgi:drug/metabolite transporter (DMT)-like permease